MSSQLAKQFSKLSLLNSANTLSTVLRPSLTKVNALPSKLIASSLSTSSINKINQTTQLKEESTISSIFDQAKEEISAKPNLDKFGKPIEREYKFSTANFKISPQKLNLLANQIQGLPIKEAILQMQFSQKRAAKRIMNSLCFARKNAGLQFNFDPERMYVSQAWVGKGFYGRPQIDIKGRGHFGIKRHPYSHMKFLFKEKASEQVPTITGMKERRNIKGFKLTRKVWMPVRDTKPIYNYKNYYNW